MAIDTIKSSAVLDGAIATADIADDAVTSAKLDTNIAIDGKLGIGDSTVLGNKVHIRTGGSATSVNASAGLVLEDDDNTRCDLQFMGPNGAFHSILFGDVSDDDIGKISYSHSGNNMRFTVNAAERMRLTADGLTFNGDTAAANALDDYEEGTLTPTLSCTGGNTGIVYNTQVGRYVKIGNMVHVNLYIELSSKGSASGYVRISGAGFPFTPINTTGFVQVGQVSLNGTVNGQQFDGSNDIWGQLAPGDATLRIYADSDGDVVQLDTGDISGTSFRVNISYFV